MSLDLSLLPFEHDGGDFGFSHSVLRLDGDRDLFDDILKIPQHPVPRKFNTYLCRDDEYEDTHYGNTQETPYGEPLGWIYAKELLALRPGSFSGRLTRAAWAYLRELDPLTKVALYWS